MLKQIGLTFIQLLKQIQSLPQSIVKAVDQRQQLVAQREFEVERLDRIRNPSKYRGK
jgi:hypothetical protein